MPVVDFTKTQATAVPAVDETKCRACRKCLARTVCKSKAIIQIDPEEPPFVDASLCYGCHACIPACPQGAIYLPSREPRPR
ncbi:MAG: 4Fe-4S binding protein [Anaerolineae bacterium]